MHESDWRCPNCGQMVQPKRKQNLVSFVLALLCSLVAVPALLPAFGLSDWVGQWWLIAVQWSAVAISALAALPVVRSCPICKTTRLEHQVRPPAA